MGTKTQKSREPAQLDEFTAQHRALIYSNSWTTWLTWKNSTGHFVFFLKRIQCTYSSTSTKQVRDLSKQFLKTFLKTTFRGVRKVILKNNNRGMKILNVVTVRWWVEYRTGGIARPWNGWMKGDTHLIISTGRLAARLFFFSIFIFSYSKNPPTVFPRFYSTPHLVGRPFDFHDVSLACEVSRPY